MSPDLGICLPARWHRRSDPARGVLVSARPAAVPPSGVRPELVLRCAPADGPLRSWREAALADLAARLPDFELEDADEYDHPGGEPVAYARFAHAGPAVDLVSEQWAWLVRPGRAPGLGVTLTGTVARVDYPDWCEVFEAAAGTVDLARVAAVGGPAGDPVR